ncbi:MAG TPA: sugar ABC transporter substrate-binding protein [Kineosporiaceae bacterium]|nr:sugar ABC transporter substrate-binding protein [Kineosporiaceae bacterium]
MNRNMRLLAGLALIPFVVTACGGGSGDSESGGAAKGTVNYWLWDANQQPVYEKCATDFHAKNPAITVKVTQKGWDDYWSGITTGMVSGTAPDVFTDHLAKFPDYMNKKQILPLDEFIEKDKIDTTIYEDGLAELWVGNDGKRYGLPKDWDTIALFYNKKLTDAAGLTPEQMGALAWNPTDGGTYEKAIAHLTVDKNGKRGDEAGFDKTKVKTYGLWMEGSGTGPGQTQWSMYTATTDWQFTDKNPWGTKYNYADPKFVETIKWWKGLADKGYMPSFKAQKGAQWSDQLAAGNVAMATNGSWMIGAVFGTKGITPAVAPTPIGPNGKRASMFNGLSDSIYAGTKNKTAAWEWVKYLASPACQDVVADAAVVFPAIKTSVPIAEAKFKEKNIDVSAFTVHLKDKTTFLFPITDHGADVEAIMQPAMDAAMTGTVDAAALVAANNQVNALFAQ